MDVFRSRPLEIEWHGVDIGSSSEVSDRRRTDGLFTVFEPTDIKRLRGLEAENAELKRILAERDLEIDTA